MKITEMIQVAQSPDSVWELFQDVPSLSRCLPGAELTADLGDGNYEGTVGAKLGPMTANFEGTCTVTPDAETRTCTISGKGADKRGGSVGTLRQHQHHGRTRRRRHATGEVRSPSQIS